MSDYVLYRVKATLITPLHIGSGRELLHEYDYAVFDKRTWRINEAALLDAQDADDAALASKPAALKPAALPKPPTDFRVETGYFRYVIQGTPRSQVPGAQVREQLKDVYDRPYLPGSSLKGALRTASRAAGVWCPCTLRGSPGASPMRRGRRASPPSPDRSR